MQTFIFIDSLGDGYQTTCLFKAYSIKVINIKTPLEISNRTTNSIFDNEIVYDGIFTNLVATLSKEKILGIYTPTDYNQELKYKLIEYFFPERINNNSLINPVEKKSLQQFVSKCGLPALECVDITDNISLIKMFKVFDKVIMKPNLSMGSVDTIVVSSSNYKNKITPYKNQYCGFFRNSSLIAQPYIQGNEYTCSFSWYYHKNNLKIKIRSIVELEKILINEIPVPYKSKLVASDHRIVQIILKYLQIMCKNLKLKFGSASFGFIHNKQKDILYTIDFNDRLSGISGSNLATLLCTGSTQMQDYFYLHLLPEKIFDNQDIYSCNKKMCILYLLIKEEGVLDCSKENVEDFERRIKCLESYKSHNLEKFKIGRKVEVSKTATQQEQIARVILCHEKISVIIKEEEIIRKLENDINISIKKIKR